MELEEGLTDWLSAQVAVTNLVSDRIYPIQLPQSTTYPCITYNRDATRRQQTFDGPSDLVGADIQIDCWAGTYQQARQLAKIFRDLVNGFSGNMGSVKVYNTILEAEIEVFEQQVEKYRCSLSFLIWHTEQ